MIDASALVEVVLHTELGEAVANTIRDRRLIAPELIDAEVLATLRRSVLAKSVSEPEVSFAVVVSSTLQSLVILIELSSRKHGDTVKMSARTTRFMWHLLTKTECRSSLLMPD